jgi:alanine racemase
VDSFYRPTWVEISLDALRHNLLAFRRLIPTGMNMMAVVKADAYGHGAIDVAKEAVSCGAKYLAVAFLDEALELRRAGILAPILVLGYTSAQGIKLAMEYDITLNVYSSDVLEAIAREVNLDHPLKIHIKLDTGMGRLGLHREDEAIDFIEQALSISGVDVEGLFTHFACADEPQNSYTVEQHQRFDRIVQYFAQKGVQFAYIHTGNSATAIEFPELTYNMVRLGISMYGLYPSTEVNRGKIELQPVMSLKTRIVMVKTMPAHAGISYGSIYHTQQEEERIATLPVGYADGYSRMLTGKAEALVRGRKVPVVGTICMDQCMLNVTELPDVGMEDEVVLFGRQGDQTITADDLALQLGTIHYEITCMISHRVPRVYVREGKIHNTVNPLQHQA